MSSEADKTNVFGAPHGLPGPEKAAADWQGLYDILSAAQQREASAYADIVTAQTLESQIAALQGHAREITQEAVELLSEFKRKVSQFCLDNGLSQEVTRELLRSLSESQLSMADSRATDYTAIFKKLYLFLAEQEVPAQTLQALFQPHNIRDAYKPTLERLRALPPEFIIQEPGNIDLGENKDNPVYDSVISIRYQRAGEAKSREILWLQFENVTCQDTTTLVLFIQGATYHVCDAPCGMVTKVIMPELLQNPNIVVAGRRNVMPQPEILGHPYRNYLVNDQQPAYMVGSPLLGSPGTADSWAPGTLARQILETSRSYSFTESELSPEEVAQWYREKAPQYAEFKDGNLW